MRKYFARALTALVALTLTFGLFSCDNRGYSLYNVIGETKTNPEIVTDRSKCPWDMVIYDGALYVGGGDYSANTGPCNVMRRDPDSKAWKNSGTVADEEITRFILLDGKLAIPGTDPTDDWTYGNYYVLENDGWVTYRNIPGAVHNFDMLKVGNRVFAALGVEQGNYPLAVSDDGGNSFRQVQLQKNMRRVNTKRHTKIRAYDLFELDGEVYALVGLTAKVSTYEIYRYEDGVFRFFCDWTDQVSRRTFTSNFIGAKINVGKGVLFTTGSLYYTETMSDCKRVEMDAGEVVYDIYQEGEKVYVLTAKRLSSRTVTVYVKRLDSDITECSGDAFTEVLRFNYSLSPLSLAVRGNDFYIGMGNEHTSSDKSGKILHIKIHQ